MRRPVNMLVVCSSAMLLGPGSSGSDTHDTSPLVASEHQLNFAYLPREHSTRAVIPALLTTSKSGMSSVESPPLQFELLASPDL
jgi:hypothetical protein